MELINVMKEKIGQIVADEEVKQLLFRFVDYKATEGFHFGDLLMTVYRIFDGNKEEIMEIAAAMECFILSSDIFDDIEDGDTTHLPWMKLPQSIVLNVASGLLVMSAQMIEDSSFHIEEKMTAKKIFNDCFIHSMIGQHGDLSGYIITEEDYIQVTRKKSGSLVSLAIQLGAVFSCNKFLEHLKYFGELLGIKAQIDNDVIGVVATSHKNDLIHKKMTLPIIYLLNQREKEIPLIAQYYKNDIAKEPFMNELPSIIPQIKQSGAIEYALVISKLKKMEAINIINQIEMEELKKKALIALFP